MTTAFTALHGHEYVRNMSNLAAPIDFRDNGLLTLWARQEYFPVDLVVDTYGNMPSWLLQTSFKWLRPTTEARSYWTLWERLDQTEKLEDFIALSHWADDNVSVPGETYRKFVRECYQDNRLVRNTMQINGRLVNLGDIRCSLLNVVASQDHICPPQSAAALESKVSSADVTALTIPGGHVGAIVGRSATDVFWPRLSDWLNKRSGEIE